MRVSLVWLATVTTQALGHCFFFFLLVVVDQLNKVRSRWMRCRCRYTVDPLLDKLEDEGVIVAVVVAGSGAVVLVR